jgi:hypothetical protein
MAAIVGHVRASLVRMRLSRSLPPLPARSIWYVSGRVEAGSPLAAAILSMGITEFSLDGHPAADTVHRLLPGRQELKRGQRVVATSAASWVSPDGKHKILERNGLALYPRPEGVPEDWPNPIYRVGYVKGLRWVVRGGEPSWIVCDALTVVARIPSWRLFGRHGEDVAAVLEGIGRLQKAQVRRFPHEGRSDDPESIPPRGHLLFAPFSHAARQVIVAIEHRVREIDQEAGGEIIRGGHINWEITEPTWLAAMDAAGKAATAAVLRDRLTSDRYLRRTEAWRELQSLA